MKYILLTLFSAVYFVKMAGMSIRHIYIFATLMGVAAWFTCHYMILNGINLVSDSFLATVAIIEGIIICISEIKGIESKTFRKISSYYPSLSILFTGNYLTVWFIKSASRWNFSIVKIIFAISIAAITCLIPILMRKLLNQKANFGNIIYKLEIIIIIMCIFILN